jgi:hypothetical protein
VDHSPVSVARPRSHPFRWLGELILLRSFEWTYTQAKNLAQDANDNATAFANAARVVRWQDRLGLFVEPRLQDLVIGNTVLVRFLNLYYTLAHFLVTVLVLLWLYLRHLDVYTKQRSVLLAGSMVALIGYFVFPLAPPRMYNCNCIVDTLDVVGGSWSYYSQSVKSIANPYAAMPSVHMMWALWVAIVVVRTAQSRALRMAGPIHAVLTFAAITMTGNHYWLDAVGGALVLAIGAALVEPMWRWWRRPTASDESDDTSGSSTEQLSSVAAR